MAKIQPDPVAGKFLSHHWKNAYKVCMTLKMKFNYLYLYAWLTRRGVALLKQSMTSGWQRQLVYWAFNATVTIQFHWNHNYKLSKCHLFSPVRLVEIKIHKHSVITKKYSSRSSVSSLCWILFRLSCPNITCLLPATFTTFTYIHCMYVHWSYQAKTFISSPFNCVTLNYINFNVGCTNNQGV